MARQPSAASVVLYVGVAALAALVSFGLDTASLTVRDDGIEVRGMFPTVVLAWADIGSFTRGLSVFGPVLLIRLRSGKGVPCIGVAFGGLVREEDSLREYRRVQDGLNQLLRGRNPGWPGWN